MDQRCVDRFVQTAGVFCLVLIVNAASAAPSGHPIVSNGQSAYRIAVAEDAVESVRLAADELARYVDKATGAALPVETVSAADVIDAGRPTIFVGAGPWTRDMAVQFDAAMPESFAIESRGANLVIVGDDSPGDPLSLEFTSRAGTLLGVYAFLHDHLDVRWFLPGPLWEVVPKRSSWRLGAMDRFEQPDFARRDPHRYRKMDEAARRRHALWARRNGAGMAIVGYAQHSWSEHLADVRFDEHPDWFAEVDGQRRPLRDSAPRGQICTSNPAVVRHVIESTRRWLDEHPDYDVASISANDGRGFCECAQCRALDPPASDSLTDRMFTFYANVAEEVAKTHPNRYVGAYAYSSYNELPLQIPSLPENILLTHVQNSTRMRSLAADAAGLSQITAWGEFHPHVGFYTFPVGSGYWGLPAPNTRWVRQLMPHLHAQGIVGIKLAALCYAGLQPDLYLYMRLLWDAERDVDALLDDYYRRLFGPVAPKVRRYHETIEASWRQAVEMQGFSEPWRARDRHRALLDVYEPILDVCRILLDEAMEQAPNETIRRRVEIFSDNFQLAEMLVEATRVSRYYGERPPSRIQPERVRRMIELAAEFQRFVDAHADSPAIDRASISAASRGVDIMDVSCWEAMLDESPTSASP